MGSSSTSAGSVMRAAPVPPYTRTRYLFQQSLEWLPNCWDWTLSILRYLVARITSFFLHHAIFRWTNTTVPTISKYPASEKLHGKKGICLLYTSDAADEEDS